MMRIFNLTLTALAVLGMTTGVATALTLENTQDTYVEKNLAGTSNSVNFGTEAKVYLKFDGSNITEKTYHRWDLSSVTLPRASATFEITQSLTYGAPAGQPDPWTVDVYALNDGDLEEAWGEETINYNNAPANVLLGEGFDAARTTFLGSYDFSPYNLLGHVYTVSSPALLSAINNDTDNSLTLMMKTSTLSGGSQHLAAREHATLPGATLVLGEVVPEPTTFCLFGIGLAFVASSRRRNLSC